MGNVFLTDSKITREAYRHMVNNLVFTGKVKRTYDSQFAVAGAKIGDTLNIRLPVRYLARQGEGLSLQDSTETSVPLVLNELVGCDTFFSDVDLTLSIDDFMERFMRAGIETVANKVDNDGLAQYINVYNSVGTPGSAANTLRVYLQARQKLTENATPQDRRNVVIAPSQTTDIVDALKGLFQDSNQISEQYKKGEMGVTAGFKWSEDQNVNTQVFGALGGTPIVVGAGNVGSSIPTSGWTASTTVLNIGDIITFAGAFAVNPQSRQSTGSLQQFVVTATGTSDGSGLLTVQISPSIVVSGPFQNVTAAPTASGAVTPQSAANISSPTALAFYPDAFIFACADLEEPRGVDMAKVVNDKQLGLSIRLVRAYDINTNRRPTRLDLLYGWLTPYPQWACRIQS